MSARGELEDHRHPLALLELGKLHSSSADSAIPGSAPHDTLLESSELMRPISTGRGLLLGCPDELAYIKGSVTADDLRGLSETCKPTEYVGS